MAAMNFTISKLTGQLCSYLRGSVQDITGARVTVGRPGRSILDLLNPRINVYLMDVTENPSLRNMSIPSVKGQNIQVGLDLRYLVSFYGTGTKPQDLLQATVKAMASRTILDPEGDRSPSSGVQINLVSVDLKEMQQIWDMIGARHAPSLIYRATGLTI